MFSIIFSTFASILATADLFSPRRIFLKGMWLRKTVGFHFTNMDFSAKQIAELIQGRVEGDENTTINDFAKIEEGRPGCISFLSNHKYTHYIYDTKSSIVLVDESLKLERPVSATLIRVKSAYEAVAKLLQLYASMKPKKKGIDSTNGRMT